MSTKRLAVLVASLGWGAGLLASAWATLLFARSPQGEWRPLLLLLLPLGLGLVEVMAVARPAPSVAAVWMALGGVCSFVVLAAFSLGPLFVVEAMALFAAACVRLAEIRPRWKLITVPLWFGAGLCALCPILWTAAVLRSGSRSSVRQYQSGIRYTRSLAVVHPAPVVMIGTGVLALILLLLCAAYLLGRHVTPDQEAKTPQGGRL